MLTPELAYQRAAARCATTEYSCADWQRRLTAHGLSSDEARQVVDRLVSDGFIDEARFAAAYVHDKVHFDAWGPNKIRQGLYAKGLDSARIDDALAAIDDDTWHHVLADLLQRRRRSLHAATGYELRRKLAAYAAQRGFFPEQIFRLLPDITDADDE